MVALLFEHLLSLKAMDTYVKYSSREFIMVSNRAPIRFFSIVSKLTSNLIRNKLSDF